MSIASLIALVAVATVVDPREAMVRAYEAGELRRALELSRGLLEEPTTAFEAREAALLVQTFASLRQGKLPLALEALASLRDVAAAIDPYLEATATTVLVGLGQCAHAEHTASAMSPLSSFTSPAWLRVASCWARRGELGRVEHVLEHAEDSARGEWQRAEALLARARFMEAEIGPHAARDLYRDVLVTHPLSNAARAANARLADFREVGIAVSPLEADELLPRADAERARYRRALARQTYREVLAKGARSKDRTAFEQASLGLIELDVIDKRYPRALASIDRLLASKPSERAVANALYLKGDVQSRLGKVADALTTFERVLHDAPQGPHASEAALAGARLAYAVRDYAVAERLGRWVLAQSILERDIRILSEDGAFVTVEAGKHAHDHAAWLLAWMGHRRGDSVETADAWLQSIGDEGPLASAALYWRASLAARRGDGETARAFSLRLSVEHPLSYYAMAARGLLCERATTSCGWNVEDASTSVDARLTATRTETMPFDLATADKLLQIGLTSEAKRIVRLTTATELGGTDRVVAARVYRASGDLYRAAMLTRPMIANADGPVPDELLGELSFPLAEREHVERTAERFDVPAELIYAVIREESAFNVRALSPRGARGLMQMMPATARRMAQLASVRGFYLGQLFTPRVAILLGGQYLHELLELFEGDLGSAVAAYHAGEKAVARWRRANPGVPSDVLIEEIPFASTRRYVKKVLASMGIYRMLRARDVAESSASAATATSAFHSPIPGPQRSEER